MSRGNVVFLRSHRINQEIRSPKEIEVIHNLGYDVKLLNWDRDSEYSGIEKKKHDNFEEIQLKFRAPAGITVIPYLFVWWIVNFVMLMIWKWDIVHAVNMDSIPAAIIAAKIKRKKVIYELLDIIEFAMALPIWVRNFFLFIDRSFTRLADAVIVLDEDQIQGMRGIPNSNVFVIYDSPPESFIKPNSKIILNDNVFNLFYAGIFFKMRKLNLEKLLEAIKDIDGIKLTLAGYGDMVEELRNWSKKDPNKIEFLGKISYEEVIDVGKQSDLFFILRDPEILVNKFTCGSTLFNSMLCEKPIIVNEGTSTSKKVSSHQCGIVLNADNTEEIKLNIIKLRDNPDLCKELGSNGIKAYNKYYSWDLMEKRINKLYESLRM
jgi:glycosyltransferase involved in cell wall biosynthesis